ncbi:11842_t:CDS:2 [Gigaspora margarita]|uniref:11842_t:CDS:1 n=1 Tax=Gigaspora margarita TaxID=4874 RepID=A0ABN7V9C0_GIGMA|nr:11842_t:CDS:2 [Gigaspora margarita]
MKALKRAQDIIEKSNDWNYITYAIQNDEFLNQYEKIFVLAILEKTYIKDQKRNEVLWHAGMRIKVLLDSNTYNTAEEKESFKREIIQNDETLTQEEKGLLVNSFHERQCEFCKNFTDNFKYCEHCIQNYLRENFCNWTSEDESIDELIQLCQQKTLRPNSVIEWISFKQFKNVIYRTSGVIMVFANIGDFGFSQFGENSKREIYGNLPYIAPEILRKCPYTTKHNNLLILDILKGIKPGLVKEPRWYVSIMKRCWMLFQKTDQLLMKFMKKYLRNYTNQTNDIKDSNLCENVFAQSNKQLFKKSQKEQEAYDIQQQTVFNSKDISTDMSFKIDLEELNIDVIN